MKGLTKYLAPVLVRLRGLDDHVTSVQPLLSSSLFAAVLAYLAWVSIVTGSNSAV